MLQQIKSNKESIAVIAMAVICLSLFFVFPTKSVLEQLTASAFFLLVVPALFLKFVLKRDFSEFGWQIGNWKNGLIGGGAALLISFAILYILLHYARFSEKYFVPTAATVDFGSFLFYEIFVIGLFVLLYEAFFRGFLMRYFSDRFGWGTTLIQFGVFLLFLFIGEGLDWENSLYILIAFFAGFLTFLTRSIYYSIIYGFFFILIADAVIIKLATSF